jgi:MOSC domain-containing protein YiiM
VGVLREDHGLAGDAHAGTGRQVSLLAAESIEKMQGRGLSLGPGDFAENLTTSGLVLHTLLPGTRLRVGPDALLEVTQIGKTCHSDCEIRRLTGDCVMPKEGVFARVVAGGEVRAGDHVEVLDEEGESRNPHGE